MIVMVRDLLAYTEAAKATEAVHEQVDADAVLAKSLENLQATIRENQATITHDPLPCVTIRELQANRGALRREDLGGV
jgi:light-regulated signal transduction histidine kinase (bacteriophytochrome)